MPLIGPAVTYCLVIDYALSACVFGETGPALALGRQNNVGSVTVNGAPGGMPDAPQGGRDHSGYGYEGGAEGLHYGDSPVDEPGH